MPGKARRLDFYPDEYIAGVGNVLRADEQGVYWMICSLIMSEGGAISENHRRIGNLCMIGPSKTKRIIDRLVELGKLDRFESKIVQKRAEKEVKSAQKRIENAQESGRMGGRPNKKTQQNQQNDKADGFFAEKLTTNHQPPTTNQDSNSVPAERPPDAFVYEFGKQVLGQKAGGLIRKLIGACEGDLGRAYGALVDAAGKQDSREYIGAVCRGPPGSRPVAELMAELEDEVRHAAE